MSLPACMPTCLPTYLPSYKRRIAKARADPGTKPELLAKLEAKMERATAAYTDVDTYLKAEFKRINETRCEIMREPFVAICACQVELFSRAAASLESSVTQLPAAIVAETRDEIAENISAGPLPPVEESSYQGNRRSSASLGEGGGLGGGYRRSSTEEGNNAAASAPMSAPKAMAPSMTSDASSRYRTVLYQCIH